MRRKISLLAFALIMVVVPADAQTHGFTMIDGVLNTLDFESAELEAIGDSGDLDSPGILLLALGPDGTLYAISSHHGVPEPLALLVLDPTTGAGTHIGDLAIGGGVDEVHAIGLAADAAGVIWLLVEEWTFGSRHARRLYRVEPRTASVALVNEIDGEVIGLAERDGVLYSLGVGGGSSTLATIDPETGSLSLGAPIPIAGLPTNLAFDGEGSLWVLSLETFPVAPPPLVVSISQVVGLPGDPRVNLTASATFVLSPIPVGLAVPLPEAAVVTVPTLGTLGMAGLTLLIFLTAVLTLRRRRSRL